MAVTQVSTIQVRRGLAQDLGNLASGELAWALDTQKLYIGNGTIEEGAPINGVTELLTSNFNVVETLGSYVYKGEEGGYVVVTGPDNSEIKRSYQNKLDDFVNVRDFGAKGNGIIDDTSAIQRAIDELYDRKSISPRTITRRALRFNAGRYRITKDLRIPPYTTFVGEGKDSVFIIADGAEATSLMTLTTSNGLSSAVNYQPDPVYPMAVFISGMSLVSNREIDIVRIDGAKDCVFVDVNFTGPLDKPEIADSNIAAVLINSNIKKTTNIQFHRCGFSGIEFAARIEDSHTSGIKFSHCDFSNLWAGVDIGDGVNNVAITDSKFETIFSYAIQGDVNATGIVSSNNTFIDVGNHYNGDALGRAVTPIIIFQADNNYSVADIFNRPKGSNIGRISAAGYAIVSLSIDDYLRLGDAYTTPGKTLSLSGSNTGHIPLGYNTSGLVQYSAKRGPCSRFGTIKFTASPILNDIVYDEEYTESSDMGLNLSVVTDGIKLQLRWTTNGSGPVTDFTFDVKVLTYNGIRAL